ncbi:flagellar motor switch protein FliN [Aquisalimonas asiatica]|uniref:Flagellar motor switch protein FliN n=1 Tax=Aquisalimonas asiatica TaxID=406100 RepID=A0A1H8QTE2_9GAMM|nr:flagellar motor switch protein FliN [Aquisalimonas asiatica]SEO57211.1 flagellar motor switch protein FliN/FliY [Aquisalimonas asiatica]
MSEDDQKTEQEAAMAEEAAAQSAEDQDSQGSAEETADAGGQPGGVKPPGMDTLQDEGVELDDENVNLDVILDIPVNLAMEIGRTKISIRHLLQLNQGSVVELDRLAGEPLDVLVNGTLIAHGEVVVVNDRFGIRLTDVISPQERVKKLK